MEFKCIKCGKLLAADNEYAGMMTECPYCHTQQPIPGVDALSDSQFGKMPAGPGVDSGFDYDSEKTLDMKTSDITGTPVQKNYGNAQDKEFSSAATMKMPQLPPPVPTTPPSQNQPPYPPPPQAYQPYSPPPQSSSPYPQAQPIQQPIGQNFAPPPRAIPATHSSQRPVLGKRAARRPSAARGSYKADNYPQRRKFGRTEKGSIPGWAIASVSLMSIRGVISLILLIITVSAISDLHKFEKMMGDASVIPSIIYTVLYLVALLYLADLFFDIFGAIQLLNRKNAGRIIGIVWSAILGTLLIISLLINAQSSANLDIMNTLTWIINIIYLLTCVGILFSCAANNFRDVGNMRAFARADRRYVSRAPYGEPAYEEYPQQMLPKKPQSAGRKVIARKRPVSGRRLPAKSSNKNLAQRRRRRR